MERKQGVSINDKHSREGHQAEAGPAGTCQAARDRFAGLQCDGPQPGQHLQGQGAFRARRAKGPDGLLSQETDPEEPRAFLQSRSKKFALRSDK